MSLERTIRGVLQERIAPKAKELQEDTLPGKGKDTWMKDGVEMCPEECCGQPVTECECGTDCKICNCAERKEMMKEELDEKKLTPAELKKREEVAKAIERENPKMPMDQKMAIATATAKKVAEENIEEVSSNKLNDYMKKSSADAGKPGASAQQQDKRIGGQKMADDKLRKADGKSSSAKVAATEGKARDRVVKMVDKSSGRTMDDRLKDAAAATASRKAAEKDLANFKKTNEAHDEPQGQAKRMMSPLHKARMDKEKADRDRDGKLKPGVVTKSTNELSLPTPKTGLSKAATGSVDKDKLKKDLERLKKGVKEEIEIDEAKKVNSMQIHKVLAKTKNSREGIAALKKAFRVNDREAKMMLKKVMEATIPDGQTAMTTKPEVKKKDKDTISKIQDMMRREREKRMKKESLDEISRSMKPMSKRFGKAVDPKKFDAYKKHVKKHNIDEPSVRFIDDNPNHPEAKRAMKNKHMAQAAQLYKSAHKESVDEVLDTPDRVMNYKHRAKYSRDRARNSQAAHMLRGTDPSKDKDTERKRDAGLKSLNKNVAGKIRKSMMSNEKFANAAQQAAVMAKLKADGKYKKEEIEEAKKPDETVHIYQSLKKAIDMRGQKEVIFKDGSKAKISVQDAQKAMKMLDTTRMAKAKQALTIRMMKSHQDFKDALAGKKPKVDPFALRVRKEDNNPKVVKHLELAKKARSEGDYDKANYHTQLARQMQSENTFISRFKEELKEKKRMSETKGAPKGYHFTRSGQLKKGDAGQDGDGGKMLRSDPLDKQRKKIPPLPENDK